jgi:hypothetical protein
MIGVTWLAEEEDRRRRRRRRRITLQCSFHPPNRCLLFLRFVLTTLLWLGIPCTRWISVEIDRDDGDGPPLQKWSKFRTGSTSDVMILFSKFLDHHEVDACMHNLKLLGGLWCCQSYTMPKLPEQPSWFSSICHCVACMEGRPGLEEFSAVKWLEFWKGLHYLKINNILEEYNSHIENP